MAPSAHFLPHSSDVDDVILNTLGTAIGAAIVWSLHRVTSKE